MAMERKQVGDGMTLGPDLGRTSPNREYKLCSADDGGIFH